MPHIMPLILKSNNLLRGIEFRLGTYGRKDAFLVVSVYKFKLFKFLLFRWQDAVLKLCIMMLFAKQIVNLKKFHYLQSYAYLCLNYTYWNGISI